MSSIATLKRALANSPTLAAVTYGGLLFALLFTVVTSVLDILAQRSVVASSTSLLEQLEGRRPATARGAAADALMPSGSPYLEGATITVAGAALIQRVAGVVTKFGGNVLSSQVELKSTESKPGFISVLANCEIEQGGLQQMMYDLEAGMPFLFVDQLVVQAPSTLSGAGGGRLRILLAVSGQWQGVR